MKFARWIAVFSCVLFLMGACVSCHSSEPQGEGQNNSSAQVCPLGVIPNEMTAVPDDLPRYPLDANVYQDFLRHANEYEGTVVKTAYQLPTEWSVLYRENFNSEQELWMIQSNDEDRSWTYLLLMAGDHVRATLPVGVNIAGTGNTIEIENWTWERDADGSFIVTKNYQKRPDHRDSTQQSCAYVDIERYVVAGGCFVLKSQQKQEGPAYSFVCCYNLAHSQPDNWSFIIDEIMPFCEENNIYFCSLNGDADFKNVVIQDYSAEEVAAVDISSQLIPNAAGFVFIQNGKDPFSIEFPEKVEYLEAQIIKYFNISNYVNL